MDGSSTGVIHHEDPTLLTQMTKLISDYIGLQNAHQAAKLNRSFPSTNQVNISKKTFFLEAKTPSYLDLLHDLGCRGNNQQRPALAELEAAVPGSTGLLRVRDGQRAADRRGLGQGAQPGRGAGARHAVQGLMNDT